MSRTVQGLQGMQAEFALCPHELGIPTPSLYGMKLILRLGQHDCPRCLRKELNYWKSRARGAEGSLAAIRGELQKERPDPAYIRRVAGPRPATSIPEAVDGALRCIEHGATLANTSFFRCGCRYIHPATEAALSMKSEESE